MSPVRGVGAPVAPTPSFATLEGSRRREDVAIVSPVSIAIPREYAELRAADPARADRWREAIADAFERCLSAGLVGLAFDRDRSAYVFATPTGGRPVSRIEAIELFLIELPLVRPFRVSFGTSTGKQCVLARVRARRRRRLGRMRRR